jgi:hypothetical protein
MDRASSGAGRVLMHVSMISHAFFYIFLRLPSLLLQSSHLYLSFILPRPSRARHPSPRSCGVPP